MRTLLLVSLLFVFLWSVHTWHVTIESPTDGASPLRLLVSVTNDLPHTTHLLKWRTPFDALEGLYSFVILKDGKPMEYKGPIAFRLAPQTYDFLSFNSQQTRSVIVDLSKAFDFPQSGRYQVQMLGLAEDGVRLTSNIIQVDLTTPSLVKMDIALAAPELSFRNCTSAHQNIINPAWDDFADACDLMRKNVVIDPQNDDLYHMWFGTYNTLRYNTITNCINNMDDDAQAAGKEFYCNPSGCSPGVVAYVSSGAPNTIHVCQIYFQLSNRDHIFVIVHEELHFGPICGARDYVYGRQGSLNLAVSNPNNAAMNSDNYRFYGEDLYYGK